MKESMTSDIIIPHVGETTTTVRVSRWLKKEGDRVRKGEPVLEVDTDKSTMEIEALEDGVLERIVVGEGNDADALQVVGVIRISGDAPEKPAGLPQASALPVRNGSASPLAVKLAQDLGVDLAAVVGTGPGGRITQEDVRHFAQAMKPAVGGETLDPRPAAPMSPDRPAARPISPKARRMAAEMGVDVSALVPSRADGLLSAVDVAQAARKNTSASMPSGPTEVRELSRARKAIAARTTASKRDIPHFYLQVEVDMNECERLRAYCAGALGWERKPTINDLIVRTVALALKAAPEVNVSFAGTGYTQREAVSIGIAVSRDEGLLVGVLQNADRLDLRATSIAARELAERARSGKLRETDMGEKSITISNLGMFGIDAFFAIIDPPDPMILAVGRVRDQIVPIAGQPAVRPMCMLTLSADHRMLDGATAAKFLASVRARIEQPFELLG